MRSYRGRMLLGCAAFVAVAAAAYCCGSYGGDSQAILAAGVKLPGPIARSVIRGNILVGLLADGRLFSIHLTKGDTKILGTFDLPTPALDMVENRVFVASKNRVIMVDHADGKITQTAVCDHPVDALGFLSPERLYVQDGPQVRLLDLTTGKSIYEFALGKYDPKRAHGGFRTLGRSGKQLFVSVAREHDAVAVIDLEKGEVTDRFSAAELHFNSDPMHPTDVHFVGNLAYVLSSRFGYGVWTEKLGIVELKTRQYTPLTLPARDLQHPSLVSGPDGTVFLASYDGTFQIEGNRYATIVSPNDTSRVGNQLLGMWQGKALLSDRETLRQVSMPVATAQGR